MSRELSHLPPNFDVTLAYLSMNCCFPTTYQIKKRYQCSAHLWSCDKNMDSCFPLYVSVSLPTKTRSPKLTAKIHKGQFDFNKCTQLLGL